MILDITTDTGCRVRLYPFTHNGQEGVMLALTMEQPGDGRHAEVFLERESAEAVRVGLNVWAEGQHQ